MRVPDSDLILPDQRASQFDTIGHSLDRESAYEPSYVESVLFGRKRTRGSRPLPVPPGHGESTTASIRASALTPGVGSEEDNQRPTREQERN